MQTIETLDLTNPEQVIEQAEANGWWLIVDLNEIDGLALPADDARETWEDLAPGEPFEVVAVMTAEQVQDREARQEAERARRATTARRKDAPVEHDSRWLTTQRRNGIAQLRGQVDAQARFIQHWTKPETAKRLAPHMTMPEVQSLMQLLRYMSQSQAMRMWADEWERQ